VPSKTWTDHLHEIREVSGSYGFIYHSQNNSTGLRISLHEDNFYRGDMIVAPFVIRAITLDGLLRFKDTKFLGTLFKRPTHLGMSGDGGQRDSRRKQDCYLHVIYLSQSAENRFFHRRSFSEHTERSQNWDQNRPKGADERCLTIVDLGNSRNGLSGCDRRQGTASLE
jgi:hypothetical protein